MRSEATLPKGGFASNPFKLIFTRGTSTYGGHCTSLSILMLPITLLHHVMLQNLAIFIHTFKIDTPWFFVCVYKSGDTSFHVSATVKLLNRRLKEYFGRACTVVSPRVTVVGRDQLHNIANRWTRLPTYVWSVWALLKEALSTVLQQDQTQLRKRNARCS